MCKVSAKFIFFCPYHQDAIVLVNQIEPYLFHFSLNETEEKAFKSGRILRANYIVLLCIMAWNTSTSIYHRRIKLHNPHSNQKKVERVERCNSAASGPQNV